MLVPMHLGSLHAYETVLLALLAFGPFVVLAFVVVVQRRREVTAEDAAEDAGRVGRTPADGGEAGG